MRAFLAVPVTPPALEAGTALLDELRRAIPAVRWVRPEGLHLTFHFWPSLREDEVPRVLDAARDAVQGATRYEAILGGLGAFPRDGDERVLWLGMAGGQAETAALQDAVEGALHGAGFEREGRGFHPHVTLGRPRGRLDAVSRRSWKERAEVALPPFTVREVLLYRSHPGPGGSRYEVLDRLSLRWGRCC